MLHTVPIILVLTSLAGIIVLVIRNLSHWKELKQEESAVITQNRQQPSWASKSFFKSFFGFIKSFTVSLYQRLGKSVLHAKSEFKTSRDTAKHISDSLKNKIRNRDKEVEDIEEDSAEKELSEIEELYDNGKFIKAEEEAIQIIKDHPSYIPAYEFLGKLYLSKKNWLEAAEIYRFLIKKDNGNEKYWSNFAETLMGLDDFPEAIKAYKKSLEIYANPSVYVALGLAYQALADYSNASDALESALDLEPDNTQVLLLLAENYIHQQNLEAAEQVLQQIMEIEPDNHLAKERLMQLKL